MTIQQSKVYKIDPNFTKIIEIYTKYENFISNSRLEWKWPKMHQCALDCFWAKYEKIVYEWSLSNRKYLLMRVIFSWLMWYKGTKNICSVWMMADIHHCRGHFPVITLSKNVCFEVTTQLRYYPQKNLQNQSNVVKKNLITLDL